MHLPLINISTLYHLGTLKPSNRGKQFSTSLEGSWLSASRCPQAWSQIAQLGAQQCWEMKRPDAFFLDLYSMPDNLQNTILHWASMNDLIERRTVFETHYWDLESDKECVILFNTIEEAETEWESMGLDQGQAAFIAQNDDFYVLTEQGRVRAKQNGQLQQVDLFATQFWVEDVLCQAMPQVVGVYMDEDLDPDNYSAPRIAVAPHAIRTFETDTVDLSDLDDDELLNSVPASRWIQASDFCSPYTFVTTCVQSTDEDISLMVDDPAVRDQTYLKFLLSLNVGRPGSGAQLLSQAFPDQKQGMKLKDDWHVTYHSGSFQGVPCLYLVHSAIEHVFQQKAICNAPLVSRDQEFVEAAKDEYSTRYQCQH